MMFQFLSFIKPLQLFRCHLRKGPHLLLLLLLAGCVASEDSQWHTLAGRVSELLQVLRVSEYPGTKSGLNSQKKSRLQLLLSVQSICASLPLMGSPVPSCVCYASSLADPTPGRHGPWRKALESVPSEFTHWGSAQYLADCKNSGKVC